MARSPVFNLRLDDDAKTRWQAAADDVGQGLSEFVRDAVEFRIANPNPYDGEPAADPPPPAMSDQAIAAARARGERPFKGPDPKPESGKRERRR